MFFSVKYGENPIKNGVKRHKINIFFLDGGWFGSPKTTSLRVRIRISSTYIISIMCFFALVISQTLNTDTDLRHKYKDRSLKLSLAILMHYFSQGSRAQALQKRMKAGSWDF